MARGELIRKLFLSHNQGNNEYFRSVAMQVIAEEERKKNYQLARDLTQILNSEKPQKTMSSTFTNTYKQASTSNDLKASLVDIKDPGHNFNDILLTKSNEKTIKRVIDEVRKSELLRLHGLEPKSKLLLCGPPGCGKTLCADVIANELGLQVLYANFDAIVSSYLGETAANLRKIFNYAKEGQWVIFFDEFDAIGKARDDQSEHGELKRVVNSFLQLMDNFSSRSLIIAATNHEKMLDPALWRRFDEVLFFGRPNITEIRIFLTKKIRNFPHKGLDIRAQASRLKGMSYASLERICFDAIKACIINNIDSMTRELFDDAIKDEKNRAAIISRVVNNSSAV